MKSKVKMNRQLKTYFQWPVYMLIVLVMMNIWAYTASVRIGVVFSIIIVFYGIGVFAMYMKSRPYIEHELISFATEYALYFTIWKKFNHFSKKLFTHS